MHLVPLFVRLVEAFVLFGWLRVVLGPCVVEVLGCDPYVESFGALRIGSRWHQISPYCICGGESVLFLRCSSVVAVVYLVQ